MHLLIYLRKEFSMISQAILKSRMRDNFCRFLQVTVLALATLLHTSVYAGDLPDDGDPKQSKQWHQTETGRMVLSGGILLATVGITVGTAYYLFSQPSKNED